MKQTILVIEDNDQNLYLTTFILEKHGYRVISARDGPDGLTLAARDRPALILLDVQLPGIDGYEVARRILADASLRSIPIVAVTSFAMAGDRERIMAAGCAGYLEKPINPDTFINQVEAFLKR